VSHLIYNKILINFLKEKKLKNNKIKKKTGVAGQTQFFFFKKKLILIFLALGVVGGGSATPYRPVWGGRSHP
jgi:hypothetical protein